MDFLILLHALSTFFMSGVISVVQRLHYPSFEKFKEEEFAKLMVWHQREISWIVLPAMLVELGTAVWIYWLAIEHTQFWAINLILLILIWISTFVFQAPTHGRLLKGYSKDRIVFLIHTNWIRTFLWMLRSLMLIVYLYKYSLK